MPNSTTTDDNHFKTIANLNLPCHNN